jgi:lysophospholipase L1-like esterase
MKRCSSPSVSTPKTAPHAPLEERPAPPRRRRQLKTLALVAALLCLAGLAVAGAAELFLRAYPQFLPEAAALRLHWAALDDDTTLADPDIGYVYPPHHKGEFRHGSFGFTYTTDEHGFRNPSPWPAKANIVVLGNSQAFGYGVDDPQAWTRLLADSLPGVKVVNLGLIGAAPQQYLRIYQTLGVGLHPDLVLVALYPGYALTAAADFERWVEAGSPGNYDRWKSSGAESPIWRQVLGRLLEESYLLMALRQFERDLRSPLSSQTLTFADGQRMQLTPRIYARAAERADPKAAEFRRVIGVLQRIQAAAEANGSEFLVVLIPTKEEVHLPLVDKPAPKLVEPFAAELGELGMPYIDLTPYYRARAEQGDSLFFEIDVHPNLEGYRLMAEVVRQRLEADAGRLERWTESRESAVRQSARQDDRVRVAP